MHVMDTDSQKILATLIIPTFRRTLVPSSSHWSSLWMQLRKSSNGLGRRSLRCHQNMWEKSFITRVCCVDFAKIPFNLELFANYVLQRRVLRLAWHPTLSSTLPLTFVEVINCECIWNKIYRARHLCCGVALSDSHFPHSWWRQTSQKPSLAYRSSNVTFALSPRCGHFFFVPNPQGGFPLVETVTGSAKT